MGLGTVKVNNKKFKVTEFYEHNQLTIEDISLKKISEIKGLDKVKNVTSLSLSNN